MNILICGAGKMAQAIAYDILNHTDTKTITLLDNNQKTLTQAQTFLKTQTLETIQADINNTTQLNPLFKQSDIKYITDARSLLPAGESDLLLSRFIPGSLDEYQRKTMANHTAIIPRTLLAKGKITYKDVDQAMRKFESKNTNPRGDIPKLRIDKAGSGIDISEMKNYFKREDLEKLMDFYKKESDSKVFVFYKKSTPEQRIQAAFLLSMLVDIGLNIVPLSIFTDVVYPDAKKIFNLVLSRSMISIKPGRGWVMLPVHAPPVQSVLKRSGTDPLDEIYG